MKPRTREFLTKLADLMEEYEVEIGEDADTRAWIDVGGDEVYLRYSHSIWIRKVLND